MSSYLLFCIYFNVWYVTCYLFIKTKNASAIKSTTGSTSTSVLVAIIVL